MPGKLLHCCVIVIVAANIQPMTIEVVNVHLLASAHQTQNKFG